MRHHDFDSLLKDYVLIPAVIPDLEEECVQITNPGILNGLLPLGWIICILIIISNAILVVSTVLLLRKGEEPRCTYMLLGNIAVSDFLTGLIQMIEMSSIYTPYDEENRLVCIIIAGTNTAVTLVSIYSVLLISIDRFFYIIHGIRYNQLMLPHKVKFAIVAVWTLGILTGIVPLLFWRNDTSKDNLCWYPVIAKPHLVIMESVFGILPVFYVLMLYSIILYKAIKNVIIIRKMTPKTTKVQNVQTEFLKGKIKRKQKIIEDGNKISVISKKSYSLQIYTVNVNENENVDVTKKPEETERTQCVKKIRRTAPSECKAIKVVLLTTGCFACTWVPYFILSIIFVTTDKGDIVRWCNMLSSLRIASYIGALNSFLNPFIYAWWHTRFRQSVKKLYCRRKKTIPLPQPK